MNKSSRGLALSQSKGFTLIELLVVIAIIGILASIVLASLNTARKKGRDARRVSDLKQISLALELYYDGQSTASYPAQGTFTANSAGMATALAGLTTGGYISNVPVDPTNSTTYFYQYIGTDGATTPVACGTAPCLGYILQAKTETNGVTYTAISAGAIAGAACTVSASAPFNYCVRP